MLENLIIRGARENNLKNVSLEIPKNGITIFTGVSGSGKSSLVFDTIAAESQRQLNETYPPFIRNFLPKYSKPDVDSIENLNVSIVVNQKRLGGNSRSTLGTITDIYTSLRLLYSKYGKPNIGSANAFSFNNTQGMCNACDGTGIKSIVDTDSLFDKSKTLNQGAILLPIFKIGSVDWKILTTPNYFDLDKPLVNYSKQEWNLLLYGNNTTVAMDSGWAKGKNVKFEGVVEKFNRRYIGKENSDKTKSKVSSFIKESICDECNGSRLNSNALKCKINDYNISELASFEITKLKSFVDNFASSNSNQITKLLSQQLEHLVSMGLGYLSLDRGTKTLSGGESQRVKMVKYLNSSLTNILYIFDEPSTGLHPLDVNRLNNLLIKLKKSGNTILVVEHDPDVIKIADYIVDLGPKAGVNGGNIVFKGSLSDIVKTDTLTGKYFNQKFQIKKEYRISRGHYILENISTNNLKNITVKIPKGILTVVTGVAGSGKSTLINKEFVKKYSDAILINQESVSTNIRSNTATYTGVMDEIRNLFSKQNKVSKSTFSTNSKTGGACNVCNGLGVVTTELAYLDTIKTKCEACEGKRFKEEVLEYKLNGKSIYDVLEMTVSEALTFFKESKIVKVLQSLSDVGIGYITLGQPLNTLSGGECQRIKLAKELHKKGSIYVMDEPTTGLHMSDIKKILDIINLIVDKGNTVIIIEHNLDIIKNADWIIDLGPEGGKKGGEIIFEGTPTDIIKSKKSFTGEYLRNSMN